MRLGPRLGILALLSLVLLPTDAIAAPGALDRGFGSKGRVTTSFGGASVGAGMDLAGGRIAVAGTAQSTEDDLGVVVLTGSGALDPGFSGDGRATAGFDGGGGSDDVGRDVAIDDAGRVVVVGDAGSSDGAVVRFEADGRVDRSFGSSGKVRLDVGDDESLAGVAVDPQGRIVVAGTGGGAGNLLFVARLTTGGELDDTFSGDGWVVTNLGNSVTTRGLALQGTAPIVVGKIAATTGSDGFVARYTSTGVLDPGFDADGKRIEDFSTGFDELVDVTPDGDGLIVVGRGGDDLVTVKLTSDGGRDASFSGDGLANVTVGASSTRATGVAVQVDGRIVVAAAASDSFSVQDQVVVRFRSGGVLDTRFSGDGIRRVSYAAGTPDQATDTAVTPKGRIVLAGWAGTSVTVTGLRS